jgi:hypothetical protein
MVAGLTYVVEARMEEPELFQTSASEGVLKALAEFKA